ncbi:MAG: hypothetical protein AVDCRST_MAG89-5286, partial [uncultured Gemmatimonadetes bacterium]
GHKHQLQACRRPGGADARRAERPHPALAGPHRRARRHRPQHRFPHRRAAEPRSAADGPHRRLPGEPGRRHRRRVAGGGQGHGAGRAALLAGLRRSRDPQGIRAPGRCPLRLPGADGGEHRRPVHAGRAAGVRPPPVPRRVHHPAAHHRPVPAAGGRAGARARRPAARLQPHGLARAEEPHRRGAGGGAAAGGPRHLGRSGAPRALRSDGGAECRGNAGRAAEPAGAVEDGQRRAPPAQRSASPGGGRGVPAASRDVELAQRAGGDRGHARRGGERRGDGALPDQLRVERHQVLGPVALQPLGAPEGRPARRRGRVRPGDHGRGQRAGRSRRGARKALFPLLPRPRHHHRGRGHRARPQHRARHGGVAGRARLGRVRHAGGLALPAGRTLPPRRGPRAPRRSNRGPRRV